MFWKLAENGLTQTIQLIVTVILARLLSPADYGTLAMVTISITVLNAFAEGGFNAAIIQKKNLDSIDCNSVFILNLFLSAAFYILLFLLSPWIAGILAGNALTAVLRVFALILVLGAFSNVHSALLYRHMMFKQFFKKTAAALILSSIIGIVMAFRGLGVWALVAQQLSNKLILCFLLWGTVKWRPRLRISLLKLRELFTFGINVLANNLLETINNQLRSLIIGLKYTSEDIAYYMKGEQFPAVVATSSDYALQGVMLSVYSKTQDDPSAVKAMLRRTIKTGCTVLLPVMAGMAASAESLVRLLLTDKWLPCVPYLQLLCIVYAFQSIRTSNMQAIYGIGKSNTVFRINMLSKLVGIVILFATAPMGVPAIAAGAVLTSLLMTVIYAIPGARYFGYAAREQICDIMPPLILSAVLFACVYAVNFLPVEPALKLLLQVVSGSAVYIGLSRVFKVESFLYFLNMVKDYFPGAGR